MNKILFAFALSVVIWAPSSEATCISFCSDTDSGADYRKPGKTTCKTQCCAPGGPCTEDIRIQKDACVGGALREFYAAGAQGAANLRSHDFTCTDRCRTRKGTAYCRDIVCAIPECAAPPEGCRYENQLIVPGCGAVTCGDLVCQPQGQ